MKIWLLSSEVPQYSSGGIARYVHNFAYALGKEGHDVTLVSRGDEAIDRTIEDAYRLVTFQAFVNKSAQQDKALAYNKRPGFPYDLLDYCSAMSYQMMTVLKALAEDGLPDLIECQEYTALSYFLMQRRLVEDDFFSKVPIVIHLHSPDFIIRKINRESRYIFPSYWTWQMEKSCMLAADAIICPSQYLAQQAEELMAKYQLKVKSFPLPVGKIPDLLECAVDQHSVVYTGRIEIRKGVSEALIECSRMWENGQDFTFTLIGGDTIYGAEKISLTKHLNQKYAKWIKAGRLRFLGQLAHEKMLPLVSKASLVLIPSIWENFPNTCIEAMALGKVVLASRHGGQAEMIGDDRQCGFLFDWNIPGEFTKQLNDCLQLTPQECTQIGRRAHSRIHAMCAPDTVIPLRLAHFKQVIDNFRPHSSFPFLSEAPKCESSKEQSKASPRSHGLVSIIIVNNTSIHLQESLNSALASEYDKIEIIVVSDQNLDGQLSKPLDNRVNTLKLHTYEFEQARHIGIRQAKGEYILSLDAGNTIKPNFISKTLTALTRLDNVQMAYSWSQSAEGNQQISVAWNTEFPYILGQQLFTDICLIKRDVIDTYLDQLYSPQPAIAKYMPLFAAGYKGICIPEVLCSHRSPTNNITQLNSTKFAYESLSAKYKALYQQYGNELFCLQIVNGAAQDWNFPHVWNNSSPQAKNPLLFEDQYTCLQNDILRMKEEHLSTKTLFKRLWMCLFESKNVQKRLQELKQRFSAK